MKFPARLKKAAGILLLSTAALLLQSSIQAQSLKTVPVPPVANKAQYIKDTTKAAQLGKALFWDMQAGSDGFTACATCHFHAGADSRSKNQLNPRVGTTFELGASAGAFGPNYPLSAADFPFPLTTNDVSGSQGVRSATFSDIVPGNAVDNTSPVDDGVFHFNRRTTGRNTPSAIGAAFNFRNFWDTRAQNDFNGQNPFGARDVNAKVLKGNGTLTGNVTQVQVANLFNCSPASQAVGPPNNAVEMSAAGRSFPKLGKKLLSLTPLGKQLVSTTDSLLWNLSNDPFPGLNKSYSQMIQDAFQDVWWNSSKVFNAAGAAIPPGSLTPTNEFTMMEWNMPLFWGLAVQEYVSTLRADDSKFDKFLDGQVTLTASEQSGLGIFTGKGQCSKCHSGIELTAASFTSVSANRTVRISTDLFLNALTDNGIFSTGVRPQTEDIGIAGTDPFGKTLSEAQLTFDGLFVDPNLVPPFGSKKVRGGEHLAIIGAFKTPGLRNVELTAPYMNTGSMATLEQVVAFYSRGGNFRPPDNDTKNARVKNLGLIATDQAAVVDFLKTLTDDRVRSHAAPFDHPQLCVPNGHITSGGADDVRNIPAVGALGYGAPFPNFPAAPGVAAVSGNCGLP